jgi:hypothetical protein
MAIIDHLNSVSQILGCMRRMLVPQMCVTDLRYGDFTRALCMSACSQTNQGDGRRQ